ncbi:MAG: NUDIX domain-containing protein [Patescibacteria group bacterium]
MPTVLPGVRVRLIKKEGDKEYILMVLEETNKAALLDPGQPSKIRWRIPGGKVGDLLGGNSEESPFEAVGRELLEENHLKADVSSDPVMDVEYVNSDGLERKVLVFNATNPRPCAESLGPDHRVLDFNWFLLETVFGELFSEKYGKSFPIAKRHISYIHLINNPQLKDRPFKKIEIKAPA